jgi:large subunit ribosomal protein L16
LSQKVATRGTKLQFGSFGLRALSGSRVFSNQIEAARKVVSRTLGKTGRYWIRIFPDRPITAKPAEVGMGKGKGDLESILFRGRTRSNYL